MRVRALDLRQRWRHPDAAPALLVAIVVVLAALTGSGALLGSSVPTFAAAGDIACSPNEINHARGDRTQCAEVATAALLARLHPTAVLTLGDDQYYCGNLGDFADAYAPSWGRDLAITHPAVGNHEYGTGCGRDSATGYFTYFGKRAGHVNEGWYSYDLGSWHVIALNSECSYGKGPADFGGCGAGSPEYHWLADDLAGDRAACTLVYWHEPRFSSGEHGDDVAMTSIWNLLVAAHADVVLNGHAHVYERFAPAGATTQATGPRNGVFQDPSPDPAGIREFVVGTGGRNHGTFAHPALRGEVVRDATTFGVLEMHLHPDGYDWRFVPVAGGGFADAGTGSCH
jgi:hypothetical protein